MDLTDIINQALTMSVVVPNKTLVLYSGLAAPNAEGFLENEEAAEQIVNDDPDHYYYIYTTPAGMYLDEQVGALGPLTDAEKAQVDAAWKQLSLMIAQQAQGPVVACVAGDVIPTNTFGAIEYPALLNNTLVPSINGIPTAALNSSAAVAIPSELGPASNCYNPLDPNKEPQTALASVPAPDYSDSTTLDTSAAPLPQYQQPVVTATTGSGSTVVVLETAGVFVATAGVLAVLTRSPAAAAAALTGILSLLGLSASSAKAAAPASPSEDTFQSQGDQEEAQALAIAPDLAYVSVEDDVAAGLLPASDLDLFTSAQKQSDDLGSFLNGTTGSLSVTEYDAVSSSMDDLTIQTEPNGAVDVNLQDSEFNDAYVSNTIDRPLPGQTEIQVPLDGILILDAPFDFTGTIYSFIEGNTIDLVGVGSVTSALGTDNLLTVSEAGGGTLTLQLDPSQNFAGEGFAVSSDGNGGTDITIGTLSIAPAVTATHTEASGTAFTTQSSPAFSEGSLPITWTGTIESTYSIPSGDWTAVSGNMGAVLTSLSGTTNFADKPLAELAPASYSTLAITPPSYASVSSVSGLSATDTIGYHFSSAVPSGASFLLWAPGGNFALLQNGTVTSSDTGPETFTVSGSLDGAAVSTSGWTITVDTPSGNPPAWSYSVSPGSGQITVNTTINAPGYVFPDAVIVITPDTPVDAIEVSADTISTDEWGFAIPTALASTPVSATPPCFAEGGHIRTARGDVPVECLVAGDLVRTASGELAPIQWIGHRHVDCRRHPSPHEVWPVRMAADAFGEGLPHRDLLLSPDHAVYVDGVLIPAKYLVNGASVAQEPRDHVTYFHVELDRHDILLAEGLPCESYLDTGNRSAFANGAAQTMLHPQFAPLSWDNACAPLCTAGPQVIAARRRLLACLPELGYGLTDEVDLRIEVGGKPFRAARVVGDLHRFLLPAGTTAVRVASSVTIPAALDLANEDCRTLGVRIAGITANGRMIALESAAVGEGFWAIENGGDAAWRWTNGAGALTLGWSEGPVLLELLVRDIPQRWVRRDAEAAQSGQRRAA